MATEARAGTSTARQAVARVVGAAELGERSLMVWLRGGTVTWPPRCACCLQAGPRRHRVQRLTASASPLAFPICSACERHAGFDHTATLCSLIVAALFPGGLWLLVVGLGIPRKLGLFGLLYFVVGIIVFLITSKVLDVFAPRIRATCVGTAWPVEEQVPPERGAPLGEKYERTDERQMRLLSLEHCEGQGEGLGADRILLEFKNMTYGRQFVVSNGGSLESIQKVATAM